MKKIFNCLSVLACLVAFAPLSSAQVSAEGVVLKKTVTQNPDENGVRWITLESYVTGTVTVKRSSVPSDVILVLDVSSSMKDSYNETTRIDALKQSVNGFIDSIYQNNTESTEADENYAGNRIAILTYSGTVTDITKGSWHEVKNGIDDLKTSVSNMSTSTGTRPDEGLKEAIDKYLDGTPNSARPEANLTVVLFTDGYPSTTGSTNFDTKYASATIDYASQIKALTNANGDHAKLFTIGLITEVTPITLGRNKNTGDDEAYGKYQKVLHLMDWMSSNYPDSEISLTYNDDDGEISNTWTYTHSAGTVTVSGMTVGSKNTDEVEYYQLVGDNDLSSIFEAIAAQSGGTPSAITEDAIVEVDVVSSSFSLPSGDIADDYEPEIYIAKCTGYDEKGRGNAFADSTYVENTTDNMTNVDGTKSSITLDIVGNEISITGFNYALNYCGRRYTDMNDPETAYCGGYKLIVKIPISVNEDAVGGAGTSTNEKGSGLKVNGELIAEFEQPHIDLPISLWVMKTGLEPYENAHFKVYQDGVLYTEFILTGKLNEETATFNGEEYTGPMIKLMGLDGNYTYTVEEEKWSWQYGEGMAITGKSTATLTKNPIIFVNTLQDTNVLHAESKAANDFGAGTAITYSSKHYNPDSE